MLPQLWDNFKMINFLYKFCPDLSIRGKRIITLWFDTFLAPKGFECGSTETMIMHVASMIIFEEWSHFWSEQHSAHRIF